MGGEELKDSKEHADNPDGDHRSDEADRGPDVHETTEIMQTIKVAPLCPISALRLRFVCDRVLDADFRERVPPLATRDAGAAMHGAVQIARPRQSHRAVHLQSNRDNSFFRLALQREVELQGRLPERLTPAMQHLVSE